MAKQNKRKSGGRVTPKGTRPVGVVEKSTDECCPSCTPRRAR
ncbi:MAG: hypothetical protein AAGE98_17795 [Actinomycetota bacterium]